MKDDTTLLAKFGVKLRSERTKLKLSQEELGFRSDLDRTYISGIELGKRNPSLRNLNKIADALNLSLPELLKF